MNPEGSVVAVDIGGTTTKLALVDRQGAVEHWRTFSTSGPNAESFVEKLLAGIRRLQAPSRGPVLGVSVAIAGFVTSDGILEYNPNLPWLQGAPVGATLQRELGVPVHVESDSNAACAAEYVFGQGKTAPRFLCLTGGTGLGVGMIVQGRLLRVAHGCIGDAGHVIVLAGGPRCSCGGRGCAEALLSTAVLGQRYAQSLGEESATFRILVRDAQAGKETAVEILRQAGYWLGVAAASLSHILFPDRIAVAGGLSRAGSILFLAAQDSFREHCGEFPLASCSIVPAVTGEHATLIGAAASIFHPELR
ncbi:MAG TPA: ROK family protein [Acidobacteriaceae bacterium]|nr:ROK family protein [Acidobacteriaceae bacterium]